MTVYMRVIRPRRRNYQASIERRIKEAAYKTKGEMVAAYERIWADWKEENKPKIIARVYIRPDKTQITVAVHGQPFGWIDKGTKGPYPITAKNAPRLIFTVPNNPKTSPGTGPFGGGSTSLPRYVIGGAMGSAPQEFRSAKQVMHPGIKPRNFTKFMAKYWQKEWPRRMDNAIRQGKREAK